MQAYAQNLSNKINMLEEKYNETKNPALLWAKSYYAYMRGASIWDMEPLFDRIPKKDNEEEKIKKDMRKFGFDNNISGLIMRRILRLSKEVETIFSGVLAKTEDEKKASQEIAKKLKEHIEKMRLKGNDLRLQRKSTKEFFVPWISLYPVFMLDAIKTANNKGMGLDEFSSLLHQKYAKK